MQTCADFLGDLGCRMALCQVHRNRRKVIVFTIMCCTVIWIAMFTVGFSCCAVVNIDTSHTANLLFVQDNTGEKRRNSDMRQDSVISKKLLQDTSWRVPAEYEKLSTGEPKFYTDNSHLHKQETYQKQLYGGFLPAIRNHAEKNAKEERTVENQENSKHNHRFRYSEHATKSLPQALIIGVKKGGTRALLEFLRIHPDVRAPGPEVHFFDRYYYKGLEWYRHQMPATIPGQLTIEKTPSYLITKEVPRKIYNMAKDIKLLVVLRDPVTRAISDYTQAASKKGMKPFEQMAFLNNYTGLVNTSWGAIRIGVYAKYVDRWLKYFPLNQIHFVNGENLISNPAHEMAKVQDFLGIKRVVNEKHFYFNETKGFPCLKKTEGSGRPHCLGKSKGRQHPVVTQQVLDRLKDFYRPFNSKLYHMIGQDFKWS